MLTSKRGALVFNNPILWPLPDTAILSVLEVGKINLSPVRSPVSRLVLSNNGDQIMNTPVFSASS